MNIKLFSLKKLFDQDKMVDDNYRYHLQMIIVPLFSAFAGILMFIMNIFTGQGRLLIASAIFALLNIFLSLLVYKRKVSSNFSYSIFGSYLAIFCIYFLLDGGVDGFSSIWMIIFAAFGVPILGKKRGLILCTILFVILIFFFWTPLGISTMRFEHSANYKMRFTGIYVFALILGYLLEEIRFITNAKLQELHQKYETLSNTDPLTGLYNRRYMNLVFSQILELGKNMDCLNTVFIADIDDFKRINDNYGHLTGDNVLTQIGHSINDTIGHKGHACRWGGEEFFVIFQTQSYEDSTFLIDKVLHDIRELTFEDDFQNTFHITVSIGATIFSCKLSLSQNQIIKLADDGLYKAKEAGKNRIVINNFED